MKTAAALGAEVVFIDLPHHALIRPHAGEPTPRTRPPTPAARATTTG